MKKKEKVQLQSMKAVELKKLVRETKDKLARFCINRYSKQSKNVREITAMKKKIAVAATFIREKELTHE